MAYKSNKQEKNPGEKKFESLKMVLRRGNKRDVCLAFVQPPIFSAPFGLTASLRTTIHESKIRLSRFVRATQDHTTCSRANHLGLRKTKNIKRLHHRRESRRRRRHLGDPSIRDKIKLRAEREFIDWKEISGILNICHQVIFIQFLH